jgi:hypothetical protein
MAVRPVVFLIASLSEGDLSVRFAGVCEHQQLAGEVL